MTLALKVAARFLESRMRANWSRVGDKLVTQVQFASRERHVWAIYWNNGSVYAQVKVPGGVYKMPRRWGDPAKAMKDIDPLITNADGDERVKRLIDSGALKPV